MVRTEKRFEKVVEWRRKSFTYYDINKLIKFATIIFSMNLLISMYITDVKYLQLFFIFNGLEFYIMVIAGWLANHRRDVYWKEIKEE